MRRNQQFEAVVTEIARVGGRLNRVEHRRHLHVYWTINGRGCLEVLATTSRSYDGLREAVARVKRQARAASA